MLKFDGTIVQLGFGAVGKSFFEKVSKEITFSESRYFVISANKAEFDAYLSLNAMAANFITCELKADNFREVFGEYLKSGDLLIDFAETVATSEFCDWCAQENVMYINTSNADWPEHWLDLFELSKKSNEVKEKHAGSTTTSKHPIVLQHGNNPGLVSHFVKAAIEYIAKTQKKKNKQLRNLIKQNLWGEAARELGIRTIHVNDIDNQVINGTFSENTLVNTWCIDTFFFEMLTEATLNLGTHENFGRLDNYKTLDKANGYLEFNKLAADTKYRTYYPGGALDGFLVPHDETITIAKSLEVRRDGRAIYRPTVMFIYSPCKAAVEYLNNAKVNSYPNPDPSKPQDCDNKDGQTIIRGYRYPQFAQIAYREMTTGTEYVGVLLLGESFDPVWVGNRVEPSFLHKKADSSYWQTPTITPVSMSALAAVCWMIKNKDRGGVYYPDDIMEYKYILKIAEKYISKTLYKTFSKETIQ